MKKIITLSVAALLTLTFACCKKTNNAPSNTASVMFVNGAAGAATLSATANSGSISGASNISFLANTGYQNVTAGSGVNLAFVVPGINSTLSSGSETLTNAAHYTAFAGGLSTGGQFVFTTDDLTAPTTGMAKIRMINLSSDALTLTFSIDNVAIDSGTTSAQYTPFFQVASGSHTLTVGDVSTSTLSSIIHLSSQTLSAGKIYTLMYTGTGTGTGTAGYTLTLIDNN